MHWVSGLENSRPVNRSILSNFRFCYFKHEKISAWTKAWKLIAERNELFDVGDWTTLLQNICSSNWNSSPKFRVESAFCRETNRGKNQHRMHHRSENQKKKIANAKLLWWWALQNPPTMRTQGTKRWSCDFVTGCFRPLPAAHGRRCNGQRGFFFEKACSSWIEKTKRPGSYDTNSLSLSLYIYIYLHACICVQNFFPVSWFHSPCCREKMHLFTICFQQYLLTKTRKKETPWHCLESISDISLVLIVDVQKPSFARLRLIVKCATPWKIVVQDDAQMGPLR